MRIFNKIVESKTEPSNKSDIWFDGEVFKIYKAGEWQAFTIELDAANTIKNIIDNASNVYQEKLTAGEGISIENNVISTDIPDWNAKEGEAGFIENKIGGDVHLNPLGNDFWINEEGDRVYQTYCEIYYSRCNNDSYGGGYRWFKIPYTERWESLPDACYGTQEWTSNYLFQYRFSTAQEIENDYRYEGAIIIRSEYEQDWNQLNKILYCGYNEAGVENPIREWFISSEIARQESIDELREETTALWDNLDHGKFPNLVAGDLYGHGESAEAEFSFRASGGKSIKDGTAYVKEIQGNAVVWNQLINGTLRPSGNTTITNDGDVWTITPDGENVYPGIRQENFIVPKGHKYLVAYETLFEGALSVGINLCGQSSETNLTSGGSWISDQSIIEYTTGNNNAIIIFFRNAKSDIKVRNFIVIDLTQMFGAGNEPTTIEDFYRLLPTNIDINAYNVGEVIPFTADGIKSVGDNAWDEQWEVGNISVENGGNIATSLRIRTKDYIQVIGGESYVITMGNASRYSDVGTICYYDNDKRFISATYPSVLVPFTIPANAKYIRIVFISTYGTTYKNDITISLYHSGWKAEVDNTYKPYWEDTLMLDARIKEAFPNGMYRAGSAYDEIRFNKETNKWEAVKRIGEVDMGSLDWFVDAFNNVPTFTSKSITNGASHNYNTIGGALIAMYTQMPSFAFLSSEDKVFTFNSRAHAQNTLAVRDSSFTDVASLKAMLQEKQVKLYYELAEPIVIPLGEFDLAYKVADFGTEEIIGSEPSAPFNGRTIYQFNAVDQIRENYNEIEKIKAALAKAGITI